MFFVVCNSRTREFQTEEEAAAVTEELKKVIYHSEKKLIILHLLQKNLALDC